MPEGIRFLSPEERSEREIAERLIKEGGIFYREEVDPKTGETKRFINILGVELETYAPREDIERIKQELVLSPLDQKLLRIIAECYKLKQTLMLEGDPGSGKTFLLEQFVRLIHGYDAPLLILVGTPRTSELEILGHWAPKASQRESKDPVVSDTLRRYDELEARYREITDEFDRRYAEIKSKLNNEEISKEEASQQIEELVRWFKPLQERYTSELQSLVQRSTLTGKVEWEFKEGALLQAYSGRGGRGYILIIDEFNLIPLNYQQIFLQVVGKEGALSSSISYWGDTGETVYPRGQDTWICFASNYPEKTPGRSEVVAPMTDRLVWVAISTQESKQKKEALIKTAGGRLKKIQRELSELRPEIISIPVEKGLEWAKVLDEELGRRIAEFVFLLDETFVSFYEGTGDSIEIKGQRRRRTQQFEFSGRNPLRLFSYLDHFQVRNSETGLIDIPETLRRAYELYYVSRLADPEARKKALELFKDLIEPPNMPGIRKSEEILRSGGKSLPPGAVIFEGEIMSYKEVFDILVKRASMTSEKKESSKKDERRRLTRARFDAIDAIMAALNSPNVPDTIKEMLSLLKNRIEDRIS
jgi:MoxR-like ATPase